MGGYRACVGRTTSNQDGTVLCVMKLADLIWGYLDSRYESSVPFQFGRYGLELDCESLPADVV